MEKPIIRWAGGKTWLLKEAYKFLPANYNNYHEPFLGGGSFFFHLQPRGKSYLSDSNIELMNVYIQIRDDLDNLISILQQFHNTEEDYYSIRNTNYQLPLEMAAQFIYLNRTCFNGLYRVNLVGKFNVPYGYKQYKQLFDFDRFRRFRDVLKPAMLSCEDFYCSLERVKKGDLVILDPPYTVTHVKNGFIKYNNKLFAWQDQERLAAYIIELRWRGAYYILTNAKHKSIAELFGGIDSPVLVSRASVISGRRSGRGIVKEYVFTNVDQGVS